MLLWKKTTSVLSGNRHRQQNTALALWFPVLTASRRGVDDERRREADRTGQKVRTKLTGGIKLPEAASWGAAILAALGGSHSCATVATHIAICDVPRIEPTTNGGRVTFPRDRTQFPNINFLKFRLVLNWRMGYNYSVSCWGLCFDVVFIGE